MERNLYSAGWNYFFWGIPALLWQFFFFYIPLLLLLTKSFLQVNATTGLSYFTLAHYRALLDPLYFVIIGRSLLLASITVVACLFIAYPVAYYVVFKTKKWRVLFFSLLVLPFWTNFLLLVYAWYFILEQDGLLNSLLLSLGIIKTPLLLMHSTFAVGCGMFYCYLPFMLLPLYTTFERFDGRLLEASKDLGASNWQTFINIMLPLTWPGIKTGALLVFIPTLGEFVTPALLGGDKHMYIGSLISHYFLTVRDSYMGSAFTCLVVAVLALIVFTLYSIYRLFLKGAKDA